ncbi:MAG: hypothetical protein REH83_05040, partial [Rickettsiella sp.]|nr:hypothetical protein [Rickettsiella sp.]
MKNLEEPSQFNTSEYLSNLRQQLRDNLPLAQLQLLNKKEISCLQANAADYQKVKAIHALLSDCQEEKLDLLCRYLLNKLISRQVYKLYRNDLKLTQLNSEKKWHLKALKELSESSHSYFKGKLNKFVINSLCQSHDHIFKNLVTGLINTLGISTYALIGVNLKRIQNNNAFLNHIVEKNLLLKIKEGVYLKEMNPDHVSSYDKERKFAPKVDGNLKPETKPESKVSLNPKYLKNNFEKNIQLLDTKSLRRGGKVFIRVNFKELSFQKPSAKAIIPFVFTLGAIGIATGSINLHLHGKQELTISTFEKLSIFFRGFVVYLTPNVLPTPKSFLQYQKEKALADQLAKQGTKFLKVVQLFDVYYVGLGQITEYKDKKSCILKIEPSFSYVNFDQKRPDLGEKLIHFLVRRKKYYQKSRRTPDLISHDTELYCAPEFSAQDEASGTGSNDESLYRCQNGFALRNKTRATHATAKVFFDLRLTKRGEIIGSQQAINVVDASQILGGVLNYDGNMIKTNHPNPVEIKTKNMNFFLGRPDLVDIVNLTLHRPLEFVITLGGATPELVDKLINSPRGLLSPHTYVYSTLLEPHQYIIELGNGAIDIHLTVAKEINLEFGLAMDDLLNRLLVRRDKVEISDANEAGNSKFVNLICALDKTIINLHLLHDVQIFLADEDGNRVWFQAHDLNSFFMLHSFAATVSAEDELQLCHKYQQNRKDQQVTCLMVDAIEGAQGDVFYVDERGHGWYLVSNVESKEIIFIPFFGKGTHYLSPNEISNFFALGISFPLENIKYYRDTNDLILGKKGAYFEDFSLRLDNYYKDPSLWTSLNLIYIEVDTFFDCDTGEHCLSGKALEAPSQEAILFEDEIKNYERGLFKYYRLSETNSKRQVIYHNQHRLNNGKWNTVIKKEKRFGFVKLQGANVTDIDVYVVGPDLIFYVKTQSITVFEFEFKNWDVSSDHRIQGFIFDGVINDKFDNLSSFSNEDINLIKRRLKKLLKKAKMHDKLKHLLSPLHLGLLKGLIVDYLYTTERRIFNSKKRIIAKSLGFDNEEDLTSFYFIFKVSYAANSPDFNLFKKNMLQKIARALNLFALSACISRDVFLVEMLFPMLTIPEAPFNKTICQRRTFKTLSIEAIIQEEITPESLKKVKNWLFAAK